MTKAKIFWSGHSQAVRLPKPFRFDRETREVAIRREGNRVILEPVEPERWPEDFWKAFGNMPEGFERPRQVRRAREELEGRGTPIGDLDSLIAAHAVSRGLVLVSNNLREFERVPGLRTENWAAP